MATAQKPHPLPLPEALRVARLALDFVDTEHPGDPSLIRASEALKRLGQMLDGPYPQAQPDYIQSDRTRARKAR